MAAAHGAESAQTSDRRNQPGPGELLAGIATEVLRASEPGLLVERVYSRLTGQISLDVCISHLFSGETLELVFASGVPDDVRLSLAHLQPGEGIWGLAVQNRYLVRREAIAQSQEAATSFLRSLAIERFCCFPLVAGNTLLGILAIGSRRIPFFSDEEIELQQAVADQVAVAFDRLLLIRELARNKQRLVTVNAELRHARAELAQIAFSASHDLREPVRHVCLYTELLERSLGTASGDAKQYLQFLSSSARRIERLTADLRAYAELSRKPTERAHIEPSTVLNAVLRNLQPLIEQTETRIKADRLPNLPIAEDDLSILLENLLENAIIHHQSPGPPDIRVFSAANKSGPVICVRDNGAGIDAKYHDKIFGLFNRLNPNHEDDSTGIGLTLCRKILERYQGQIWVESEPGEGALFCFSLPYAEANRARVTSAGS